MFTYSVQDQHGRLVFTGTLQECDDYRMAIFRIKGRDAYYKTSLIIPEC